MDADALIYTVKHGGLEQVKAYGRLAFTRLGGTAQVSY